MSNEVKSITLLLNTGELTVFLIDFPNHRNLIMINLNELRGYLTNLFN